MRGVEPFPLDAAVVTDYLNFLNEVLASFLFTDIVLTVGSLNTLLARLPCITTC